MRFRLEKSGEYMRDYAKEKINMPGPGLERSKPDQPPHRDSDDLYKSVYTQPSDNGDMVEVGTDMEYGPALEYGRDAKPPHTYKMEPRPWLNVSALETEEHIVNEILGKEFTEAELLP